MAFWGERFGRSQRFSPQDVRCLREDEVYDAALEKGCLDAMLCDSEDSAASYVRGVARLLSVGAPFLVVSNSPVRHRHLQRHFEVVDVRPLCPEDGPMAIHSLYTCKRRSTEVSPELGLRTENIGPIMTRARLRHARIPIVPISAMTKRAFGSSEATEPQTWHPAGISCPTPSRPSLVQHPP